MRGEKMKKILILGISALVLVMVALGCTGGEGNLHVLVVGENNTPLSGFKVVSNEQPVDQLKVTGITGSDGTVTYDGIKAGSYNLYVSGAGYEQQTFDVTVAAGKTTNKTITMTRTSPPPATT